MCLASSRSSILALSWGREVLDLVMQSEAGHSGRPHAEPFIVPELWV